MEAACGCESDVSLISRCAVAAPPCCWTPRFALICFGPPGRAGPLRPAVAGSMAIPGLFRPVLFGDGVLIDGGAMNPLPYDRLKTVPGASFAPRINSQPLMTIFPDRCP